MEKIRLVGALVAVAAAGIGYFVGTRIAVRSSQSERPFSAAVWDPSTVLSALRLKFVVGSANPAKIAALRSVVARLFPNCKDLQVVGREVHSGVSSQPMTPEESIAGAKGRAAAALAAEPDADFGVGQEGGVECVGGDTWFECGWIVVRHRSGKIGVGSSARFQVAPVVMDELKKGTELGLIVDRLTGQSDVRSSQGMMGIITLGHLPRPDSYAHGIIYALAPFISPQQFWTSKS